MNLGQSLSGARAVGQHLVLAFHARPRNEVSLVARDVGDVVGLGDGALVARVVDVISAGVAVEEVLKNLLGIAEGRIVGLLAVCFAL